MKTEILDICPDCGGNLDGTICNECNSIWKFRKGLQKNTQAKESGECVK